MEALGQEQVKLMSQLQDLIGLLIIEQKITSVSSPAGQVLDTRKKCPVKRWCVVLMKNRNSSKLGRMSDKKCI